MRYLSFFSLVGLCLSPAASAESWKPAKGTPYFAEYLQEKLHDPLRPEPSIIPQFYDSHAIQRDIAVLMTRDDAKYASMKHLHVLNLKTRKKYKVYYPDGSLMYWFPVDIRSEDCSIFEEVICPTVKGLKVVSLQDLRVSLIGHKGLSAFEYRLLWSRSKQGYIAYRTKALRAAP